MRRLVIASICLSSGVAAAQSAEPAAQPPATEPPAAEPATAEPAPAAMPAPAAAGKTRVEATYDNGLVLESDDGKYELKIQFRTQMRFESQRALEDGSQFLNKFYIPRSRMQVEGHVFGDADRYKVELGMGDSGSYSFVKDTFIEHRLSTAPVWLRFGQWKRPFFRQELVSDFASQFNERSIVDELASGGRDIGIALHNDYEKSAEGIEWVVGMFNGFSGGADRPSVPVACSTNAMTGNVTCVNGRPSTFPADFGPTLVARAGWNSAHAKGYSEADLDGGPLRYAIGAAYKIDLANFAKHGQPSLADNLSHGLELDWNIKASGFSFSGGVVMMKLKANDPEYGAYVQPGYMVVPKHIELAGRFALTTEGDRNRIEAAGAFNYYVHGHRMKIATDFGIIQLTGEDPVTMATDDPDIRVRIMGQLEL
jgi:hypothetical protein